MSAILACAAPLNKDSSGTQRFRRVPLAWTCFSACCCSGGRRVWCLGFCLPRLVRVSSTVGAGHLAELILIEPRCW